MGLTPLQLSLPMKINHSQSRMPSSNRCGSGYRLGADFREGFTLFEILMAVTITATAGYAMIASLKPATTQSANARGAVDELACALRVARQTAIAKQRPVEVRLTAVASGQWVEQVVTGGGLTLTQPIIIPLVAPPGVTVRGWPGSVRFDASGMANRSLDLGVGYTGREYRLRLYQASGVIRINRP